MDRLAGAAELLDGPLDDPVALEGNLRDLRRVNRLLGGVSLSGRALDALVGRVADAGTAVSLLDVGTGGADIPLALLDEWGRRGRRLHVTGVDDRSEVLAAARVADPRVNSAARLTLEQADGRSLPYPDASFDVAHCSLVLHHLSRGRVALLWEIAWVARRASSSTTSPAAAWPCSRRESRLRWRRSIATAAMTGRCPCCGLTLSADAHV